MPEQSAEVTRTERTDLHGNTQDRLIECFGQPQDLITALELSEHPRAHALACALETRCPEKPSQLIALARKYGFTPRTLLGIWSNYKMAQADAVVRMHLPEIARDLVEDSRSTDVSCPTCNAIGQIAVPDDLREPGSSPIQLCPQCQGRRTIRKPGDADSRKTLLEAIGLIGGAKATVSIKNNLNFHGVESVLDEIEGMREKRKPGLTLDAEPVP